LHHVKKALAVDAELSSGRAVSVTVLIAGILLGLGVAFVGSCCLGPTFSQAAGQSEEGKVSATLMMFSMLLSVVAGIGIGIAAGVWSSQIGSTAQKRWSQQMGVARGLQQPSCCEMRYAIRYHGWSGSVHSFEFDNPDVADAFRQANPRKVMG
jgi:formate hydrogenlyase subunit 3/multisubunit Na+/H+ antiporter MnhD subunit